MPPTSSVVALPASTHATESSTSAPDVHEPTMPAYLTALDEQSDVQEMQMLFWDALQDLLWYWPAAHFVHGVQYLGPLRSEHGKAS